MKRVLSVILSVLMVSTAVGCSKVSRDDSTVQMISSQAELTVSRTQSESVYGVETPASEDDIVLDTQVQDTVAQPESDTTAASVAAASVALASAGAVTAEKSGEALENNTEVLSAMAYAATPAPAEVRGVWMSYIDLDPLIRNKTKAQFTANIDEAFGKVAAFGMNTVFVQVRPFADALYNSKYFPWSSYLTGTEGKNPGYDPLTIMCDLADTHGLRIEAWINPYRVRLTQSVPLASNNQAKKWLASGSDAVIEWNGGIFYNPGNAQARALIVNGVKEIVTNYRVDGIHFDDYFYPTTDMAFDQATYKASGTTKTQADWRRENVNILVRDVYSSIKKIDPNCLFGISPQGNTKNNYDVQFIDVKKWLSNPGYLDYICPQIYFGFENGGYPFTATVELWNNMIKIDSIKLYIGLAAYKLGKTDEYAGAGKNEWLKTTDILARMVQTARTASHYGGVVFFSYESLFRIDIPQVQAEKAALKKLF